MIKGTHSNNELTLICATNNVYSTCIHLNTEGTTMRNKQVQKLDTLTYSAVQQDWVYQLLVYHYHQNLSKVFPKDLNSIIKVID